MYIQDSTKSVTDRVVLVQGPAQQNYSELNENIEHTLWFGLSDANLYVSWLAAIQYVCSIIIKMNNSPESPAFDVHCLQTSVQARQHHYQLSQQGVKKVSAITHSREHRKARVSIPHEL